LFHTSPSGPSSFVVMFQSREQATPEQWKDSDAGPDRITHDSHSHHFGRDTVQVSLLVFACATDMSQKAHCFHDSSYLCCAGILVARENKNINANTGKPSFLIQRNTLAWETAASISAV